MAWKGYWIWWEFPTMRFNNEKCNTENATVDLCVAGASFSNHIWATLGSLGKFVPASPFPCGIHDWWTDWMTNLERKLYPALDQHRFCSKIGYDMLTVSQNQADLQVPATESSCVPSGDVCPSMLPLWQNTFDLLGLDGYASNTIIE